MAWSLAAVLSALSGCAPDPVAAYRVGAPFDIAAFRNEYGEENMRTVRFDRERYEYRECSVDWRGDSYRIEVSPAGRVLGIEARIPCETGELLRKESAFRKRLDAQYPDASDQVEIWLKCEPKSHRLVATCREPTHARLVRGYRERTRKPER